MKFAISEVFSYYDGADAFSNQSPLYIFDLHISDTWSSTL